MKIQPFEGDPKRRWAIDRYGWPLGPGALKVSLQEKRWWGWRTIGSNHAHSPGEIDFVKRVILNTPLIDKLRQEERARAKKTTDEYLNS